jgi:hypothetical protein
MKTSLKIATGIVFVSTLFLNFSFDSSGHFKLISQAKAVPQTWKLLSATCPDGKTHISVCGSGNDANCTPSGTCPGSGPN